MIEKNVESCPVCGGTNFRPKRKRGRFEMGVCLDCSLGYTNPLVSGDENEVGNSNASITDPDYYANIVSNYAIQSELAKKKAQFLRDYWTSVIGMPPHSILEVGCGTGQYFEAWKQLGIDWTGVEVNNDMLEFCVARGMPVKSFDECTKINNKYDVVFLSQVLEHILEPNEFLKKIASLMAPGGLVHIDVPNHNALTSLYRKVNVFHREYGFIQPPHHLLAYTERSLSLLLQNSDYDVAHIRAYANDNPTFGQLLVSKTPLRKILFRVSDAMKRGSLLVAIAKRR